MNRTQKQEEVALIKDRFSRMAVVIFTDFRNMDVGSMVRLRRAFRDKDVEYRVVKNALVKHAVAEQPYLEAVSKYLAEPTGLAWSYEDPIAPIRVIRDFQKTNEHLKIKGGLLEGMALSPKQVEALALMPSRKELLGQISALLIAAPQALIRQMMGPARDLVGLLEARKQQLEKQGNPE